MSNLFDVYAFKSKLTGGGARPNQFAIRLGFPNYVSLGRAAKELGTYMINVAEMPGESLGVAPVFYRGREVKFAGDRVFAPWTISVLNDTGFVVRNALEQWMNGMEDLQVKEGVLSPDNYQTDQEIFQLDRNGGVLKAYKLIQAFPVDISPIALDFGANDTISNFTVTWQYQSFTPTNITGVKLFPST
ncbi:MAG: hypothetical protein EB127_08300 [Alphaproteobacteria bacterium]|nr:hypothetical protein [Alphaproteobacteria bacterium]